MEERVMNETMKRAFIAVLAIIVLMAVLPDMTRAAGADIPGITGSTFNLTAKVGNIVTGDGNAIYMWGYANGAGLMQYPGPTLIVSAGQTVTVNLTNQLSVPVSIVFPGQSGVVEMGGAQGLLAREAAASGGTVSYKFVAENPGTYMYHSGTDPDIQVEMGLIGALIVRPSGYNADTNRIAYNDPISQYDHEYLFLMTDMDIRVHDLVEAGNLAAIDTADFHAVYWFLNGRNLPDTLAAANVQWLPHQPYNVIPRIHPGERALYRFIGGGRDGHPLHTHGNNHLVIARNGRLLVDGVAGDISYSAYTTGTFPGETYDLIMTWTGEKLGWDIFGDPVANGHTCIDGDVDNFDDTTHEYCPDHGKPFPVTMPKQQDLTYGQFYSGSPFLGAMGALPPGEGGFNANGGLFFMQHSHNEKELTNNDIFPGGMGTFLIIEPPGVAIP